MSQPNKDVGDHSLLARPLAALARGVTHRPKSIVAAAVLLAAAAALYAGLELRMRSSRLDLLNPSSEYNQRWLAYLEEFGDDDELVVVVEGDAPSHVTAAIDDVAAALRRRDDLFGSVLAQWDLSSLRGKALHLLPPAQLDRIEARLDGLTAPQNERRDLLRSARSGPGRASGQLGFDATLGRLRPHYLLADGGRLGMVLLRLRGGDEFSAETAAAIRELRDLLERVGARHSQAAIGLTGMPVLECDEMLASSRDSLVGSLLSLVGVAILFTAGFGGWRRPLLTVLALLLGLAWSLGYATFAVGHLNILSAAFGVILIGLGIDFGIHYVARYLQLRRAGWSSREALAETASSVGPGIVTGGLTTALAFYTATLTDFAGVAELGLIAGGGVILCMGAAVVVLPALLFLLDRRRSGPIPAAFPIGPVVWPTLRRPRSTALVGLLLTAAVGWSALQVRYDHNLLNLQPTDLESVAWEETLLDRTDHSVWFALSVADSREELLARKARLQEAPTVRRVEEVASLLSGEDRQHTQRVARLAERIHQLADRGRAAMSGGFDAAPPAAHDLVELQHLRSIADPQPPSVEDLPPALASRFVGESGKHLLKIYADEDIWGIDELASFVRDVEAVDRRATGHPVQTYYASLEMQRSYLHATAYALLAVAIVLMLDFGSLRHTLLALTPLAAGVVQLTGLMGLLDIPFNPANMIALPLILGIGIDDGVHVVHDFRRQGRRYRISSSTATAVLLTSATTMIGFGSLMLASHQGLQSLGQVLTLGVFCCFVNSVLLLPAFLTWMTRRREEPSDEESTNATSEEEEQPPLIRPRRREEPIGAADERS